MRRTILAALVMMGVGARPALAMEDADASLFFDEMPAVLTASRLAQSPLDAPAPVTVIDREMIESSGFTEVHELLRLVPGFVVADWPDGPPVVANHGLGDARGRRVKVLIDGRTINNPLWGDVYWNDLPIRVDDIERIEVIRGPNGAAYGANAFQGVVNILTRSPLTESGTQVVSRLGGDGFRDVGVRLNSEAGGRVDWRLSASRRHVETFKSYEGQSSESFDRNVLNAQAYAQISEHDELRLQAGVSAGYDERGYPKGVFSPLRDERVQENYLHLAWQHSFSVDSEFSLSYAHQGRSERAGWDVNWQGAVIPVDKSVDTSRDDLEVQLNHRFLPDLHLLWGAGLRQDTARSMHYFLSDATIRDTQWQVFGSLTWTVLPQLHVNLGGTLEDHAYSHFLFSPRLAVNYDLGAFSALRFSTGIAHRAPSMMESRAREGYVYQGQVVRTGYFAGPYVAPEKVRHLELGYVARIPSLGVDIDARVFREDYRGYIDDETCRFLGKGEPACPFAPPPNYAPLIGYTAYTFINQGGIVVKGVEARADWRMDWGRVILSQTFMNVREGEGYIERDAVNSAPSSMTSLLVIKPLPQRWKLSVGYYHQDRMMWLNDGDYVPSRNLFDIKLAKAFGAPGEDSEFSITAQSVGGAYPEFSMNKFQHVPRVFATLKLAL
ncbi:MAG: TonB-dependent receptor [Halothiobacillaceae bacterium]|nr:TonB-dependent receptor [Halothiobacillaceae bacterium]